MGQNMKEHADDVDTYHKTWKASKKDYKCFISFMSCTCSTKVI